MHTTDSIQKDIERLQARCQKRLEANKADQREIYRLQNVLERLTAKSLLGQRVVLNPHTSILHAHLRALRGMPAVVEKVGRQYAQIRFTNGQSWRVPFARIVAATDDNVGSDEGSLLDGVSDMLNAALDQ